MDPEAALQAARFATELLVRSPVLAGRGTPTFAPSRSRRRPSPTGRSEQTQVAGLEIEEPEQRRRLERLGFEVGDDWNVRVPTWRAGDVSREIDLVEEVVRFDLERVPATQPERSELTGRLTDAQRIRRRIQDTLAGFGFAEAYTWSLLPDDPVPGAIRLPEPLSTEQAVLRTSLTDGLIAAASRNVDAGSHDIALFELAHVYLPSGEQLPDERWHVAGIVEGGFPRAKGVVEALYASLRVSPTFERADGLRFAGPGAKTAEGWVLELADGGLPGAWGLFELDVDALISCVPKLVVYEDVITYPAVKQDLAFSVAESVTAAELVEAARAAAGLELREMEASTSTAVSRQGRGGSRSPSGCRSRRPTGRSPTRMRRRYASGSWPPSPSASAPSSAHRSPTQGTFRGSI